jgi:hypothetical protein
VRTLTIGWSMAWRTGSKAHPLGPIGYWVVRFRGLNPMESRLEVTRDIFSRCGLPHAKSAFRVCTLRPWFSRQKIVLTSPAVLGDNYRKLGMRIATGVCHVL